jgi:hypothetical protein
MLGVLGEPLLCESGRDITPWGGWRAYMQHASANLTDTRRFVHDSSIDKGNRWTSMTLTTSILVGVPRKFKYGI